MKSMTAFARHQCTFDWGTAIWEIRSVNHRFLEPYFRLPDTWRELEMPLRDLLKRTLARGKVEMTLTLQPSAQQIPHLNADIMGGLKTLVEQVQTHLPGQHFTVDPMAILQWPDLLREPDMDRERQKTDLLACAGQALEMLCQLRQREGNKLRQLLESRLDQMQAIIAPLHAIVPETVTQHEMRLRERLAQMTTEVDENRLAQEVALLAQKLDVSEELDRLNTHIQHVRQALAQSQPVGRRLDFLMQELNREANTLGAKATDMRLREAAVELKVLIEQMREQVQNIE